MPKFPKLLQKPRPRQLLVAVLTSTIGVQPVLASTYQYNVYVKGLAPTTKSVAGSGQIDIGDGANSPTNGVRAPRLVLSQSLIDYGTLDVGTQGQRTVQLANKGAAAALLSQIAGSGPLDITSDCPANLLPDATCNIATTFTASTPGTYYRQMAVNAVGVTNPPLLQFQAEIPHPPTPYLGFNSSSLNFVLKTAGEQFTKVATLTNSGTLRATNLSVPQSSDDFLVSSNCGTTLEALSSCAISVTFQGPELTTYREQVSISGTGTNTARLTLMAAPEAAQTPGGTPATSTPDAPSDAPTPVPDESAKGLAFSPSALSFSAATLNATSSKSATLVNLSDGPVGINSFAQDTTDFAVSSTCPATLGSSETCLVTATFKAARAGDQALNLTAAPTSSALLQLTGSASNPAVVTPELAFTPDTYSFGVVDVNQTRSTNIQLVNKGPGVANLQNIQLDSGTEAFSIASNCGASLDEGKSCPIGLTFAPTARNSYRAVLSVTDTSGKKKLFTSTGSGGAAQVGAPATLDFGIVAANGGVAKRTLTLQNVGNKPLTGLKLGTTPAAFSQESTTCSDTLLPSATCGINLRFTSPKGGNTSGDVNVLADNADIVSVTLTGFGTQAQLQSSDSSLAFPPTETQQYQDLSFTLSNPGSDPALFDGISVTSGGGAYAQSNNCGAQLDPGVSCTITVRFSPQSELASIPGSVGIVAKGVSPIKVELSGSSFTRKLTLTPKGTDFGSVNVGDKSAIKTVEVRNDSPRSVAIKGLGISSGQANFGQSNNCGTTVESGASCLVNIQMTPTTGGTLSGVFGVDTDAGLYSATMSGTGTMPQIVVDDSSSSQAPSTTPGSDPTSGSGTGSGTPAPGSGTGSTSPSTPTSPTSGAEKTYTVTFENTAVGTLSGVRDIKFSNVGNGPLNINGISMVSGAANFNQSNNCGTTLAPQGYCTISAMFTPSSAGALTCQIVVSSNYGNFVINLAGNGMQSSGTWQAQTSNDFGKLTVGTTASRNFSFTNTGNTNLILHGALVGSNLSFLVNNCGTDTASVTLRPKEYCAVSVQYAPTQEGEVLTGAKLLAQSAQLASDVSMSLTGSAATSATAIPSGSGMSTIAYQEDFGSVSTASTKSIRYFVRNTGTTKNVRGTWSLSGDPAFALDTTAGVSAYNSDTSIARSYCESATTCTTALPTYPSHTQQVKFSPQSVGNLSATLVFTPDSATGLSPVVFNLKGSSFSPYAATPSGSGTATTAYQEDFGTFSLGNSSRLGFYVRNTGSAGQLRGTWSLVGPSAFSFVSNAGVSYYNDNNSVLRYPDYPSRCESAMTCTTSDASLKSGFLAHFVSINFNPATLGDYTAQLVFTPDAVTGLAPIVFNLKGSAKQDVAATPSGSNTVTTAYSTDFGGVQPTTTTSKTYYIRNTGTMGTLKGTWSLTGSSAFTKGDAYVASGTASGQATSTYCSSTLTCTSTDVSVAGGYPHHKIVVTFAPQSFDDYSATLTFTPDASTGLAPVTFPLTGKGQNFLAETPSGTGSTTTPPTLDFGTVSQASPKTIYYFVRNTGTKGKLKGTWSISGDPGFALGTAAVSVYNSDSAGATYPQYPQYCESTITCTTTDVANSGGFPNHRMSVKYTPSSSGSGKAVLTFTPDSVTGLPPLNFNLTGAWKP